MMEIVLTKPMYDQKIGSVYVHALTAGALSCAGSGVAGALANSATLTRCGDAGGSGTSLREEKRGSQEAIVSSAILLRLLPESLRREIHDSTLLVCRV